MEACPFKKKQQLPCIAKMLFHSHKVLFQAIKNAYIAKLQQKHLLHLLVIWCTQTHMTEDRTGEETEIFLGFIRDKKNQNIPVKLDWKQLRTAAIYQNLYSRNEGGGFSEAVANIVLKIIIIKKTLWNRGIKWRKETSLKVVAVQSQRVQVLQSK